MTATHVHGQPPRSLADVPLKSWLLAIRPKTLSAAVVPVLVGTALAHADGRGNLLAAMAALLGALFIQVGTNLVNDFYDFQKGADTHERLGPVRVTQSGLIAPRMVLGGAVACFALAAVVGLYLVHLGGWPIIVVGLLSLAAGYAYTGGPFPLAYHGLGDVFVFVFFGLIAVGGTYWVQALSLTPAVLVAGATVGALSTTLIVVNNLRDIPTDRKAGKRTMAVRLGVAGTRAEYVALLLVALAGPLVMVTLLDVPASALLCVASLPLMVPNLRTVFTEHGAALNRALGGSARVQVVFGLLLSLGIWM